MKTLKFMLAAATAIGLASASQAATTPLPGGTDFESATVGDQVTGSTSGFAYAGDENESVIEAGGPSPSTKMLHVDVGTVPLLRQLDNNATPVDMTDSGFLSLTIDADVKFTVTPSADSVEPTAGDKLMIYLKDDGASTNLYVIAGYYDDDGILTNGSYVIAADVDASQWHHLRVVAYSNICDDASINLPGFQVYLDSSLCTASGYTLDMQGGYSAEVEAGLLSMVAGNYGSSTLPTLTYVGFAGNGYVDNLAFTKETSAPSTVDFTFVLGDGVSAISWTIAGESASTALNGSAVLGTAITINSVTYSNDWWIASGVVTNGATLEAAETTFNVTATKTAEVDASGNVTVEDTTTPAALGITSGTFASEAAGSQELDKVLTWATKSSKGNKSYSAAIAAINAMDFSDSEETQTEKAYLLNCADTTEAVAAAAAAFKFQSITPGTVPEVYEPADGYNVDPVIYGGNAVDAINVTPATGSHKFYKATLTK